MYTLQYSGTNIGFNGYRIIVESFTEWDVWDLTTYNDTSWQNSLVKTGNDGTVTIDKAAQFINFGDSFNTFCSDNSLTSLTVNISKNLKFNETTDLTTAQAVYTRLSSTGVNAKSTNGCFIRFPNSAGKHVTINGNGHIISGLYCYNTDSVNAGSFACVEGTSNWLTLSDMTFDRCLFRSNRQAAAGFSMINEGSTLTTYFLNYNKCAIVSEYTGSYQAANYGFLNNNSNSTYSHIQTSYYCCGFYGGRSWNNYSCGDGGISNWSTKPKFNSQWADCTYISPVILGGNGTFKLLGGDRATLSLQGSNTYYNLPNGITAQGTEAASVQDALQSFNETTLVTSRPNYMLILVNDNLYHKIET